MRFSTSLAIAAAATGAMAQDMSICDKYTTALLKENNATNQYALLNLLVNRVVIGNFSETTSGENVPGILKEGMVNGTSVNLAPYFTGALESTNRNGKASSVNFLADGGAEPLMMNPPKPANTENSPQYYLLTHLYSFFGALLMCSNYGKDGFPAYMGNPSMAATHQFMALTNAENTYFIQQVGLAASSFGVSKEDVEAVGMALTSTFNQRCAPPTKVTGDTAELQAICQAEDCPLSPSATCDAYPNMGAVSTPSMAPSGTSMMPTPSGSGGMMPSSSPTGAATAVTFSAGAGIFGFVAALFAL